MLPRSLQKHYLEGNHVSSHKSLPMVAHPTVAWLTFSWHHASRPSHLRSDSPCLRKYTSMSEEGSGGEKASGMRPKRSSTGSMGLSLNGQPDPVVVHAGAVLSIFHLLPAIEHQDSKVVVTVLMETWALENFVAQHTLSDLLTCTIGTSFVRLNFQHSKVWFFWAFNCHSGYATEVNRMERINSVCK